MKKENNDEIIKLKLFIVEQIRDYSAREQMVQEANHGTPIGYYKGIVKGLNIVLGKL